MSNIIEITGKEFDDTVAANQYLLIDFWAKWCAPCKDFTKVVEEVAPDYPEFVFAAVDIETEKELAQEFNIRSIPAVMILKNQVIVYADSGLLPANSLRELLDKAKALDTDQLSK